MNGETPKDQTNRLVSGLALYKIRGVLVWSYFRCPIGSVLVVILLSKRIIIKILIIFRPRIERHALFDCFLYNVLRLLAIYAFFSVQQR